MNRKALIGFGAVAALLVTAITAQTVLAHTRPIRFDPPPGAVLDAAPTQVSGWFTNPLRRDPNWNFLRVTNADGARVDVGEPILSQDRRQMSVNLNPNLPEAPYLVTWYAWDDTDGHILGDCFTFFIGRAAAEQAVADRVRIDGGANCQRIDVSARDGTPVAGATPQTGHDSHTMPGEMHEDDGGGGVAVWVLMLGVAGGVGIGFVGGRFLSTR
jgi:methionine-rich copper-binding protein CopC